MMGKKNTRSRRWLPGSLLIIIMILTISGWGAGTYLELKPHSLQAGGIGETKLQDQPLSMGAVVPILTTPVKNSSVKAELNAIPASQTSNIMAIPAKENKSRKIVYLTFDDGPSSVTPKVLDILEREQVKATFFVLGSGAKSQPELIKAIWKQGHAIGNHSYDHNYDELYSGFIPFWNQIKKTEEIVHEITGTRPQLIRAPGGTFGHFDDTYFYLLKQAGYLVMDWNVDSGDSKRRGVPAVEIIKESVPDTSSPYVVLLMHDGGGHEESAKALSEIINRYKSAGYSFEVLEADAKPVQFKLSTKNVDSGRIKPSTAWIASNISTNSALFESEKPLMLEVGEVETKFASREYFIDQGQYIVPLRTTIEKLGGQVSWDMDIRSGRASINGRTLLADVNKKELIFNRSTGESEVRPNSVRIINGVIWIPLRDLLEIIEHPPVSVSVTPEERRVKAN